MSFSIRSAGVLAAFALACGAAPAALAQNMPWSSVGSLAAGDSRTSYNQYYDDHRVSLRAGQRLRITATADDLDTMLAIYRAGEMTQPLAEDDDSGGSLNPRILFEPPADGDYVIRVLGYSSDDTGGYRVQIEELPPLPAPVTQHSDTMTTTGTWRIFQGELTANDPDNMGHRFDDYRISATEGSHVMIQLDSQAFDPMIMVYRAGHTEGEPIATDDDGGPGLNSLLLLDVFETGDYIVRVTSYGEGSTGAYRLSITP